MAQPLEDGDVLLVAERGDPDGADFQRQITANYDPSCKLVQFVEYGEEVFGTLEPVTPAEWQQIVDRLGRAAPFLERVLRLVQEIERIADGAEPVPDLQRELREAVKTFAGSIEPEEAVAVAHAADKITWEKLLGDESAILIRLGQLVFIWAKGAEKISVVRAAQIDLQAGKELRDADETLEVVLEIEVPPELTQHDADAFDAFCREFVGATAEDTISPEEAKALADMMRGTPNAYALAPLEAKLDRIAASGSPPDPATGVGGSD